ncbi:MAG: hypothetical protein ACKO35_15425 [Planctomycetaceae bacterium]|jgi:hypothetical protein
MSVIRIGSNKQYADGWELIFGGSRRGKKSSAGTAASKPKAKAGKVKKAASAVAKQAKAGPAKKTKKGKKAGAR